jgi:hypothetical protein
MKKLLGIMVLGLLFSNSSLAAEKIAYLICPNNQNNETIDIEIYLKDKYVFDGSTQYDIVESQDVMLIAKSFDKEIWINRYTGRVLRVPVRNGKRVMVSKEILFCKKAEKLF